MRKRGALVLALAALGIIGAGGFYVAEGISCVTDESVRTLKLGMTKSNVIKEMGPMYNDYDLAQCERLYGPGAFVSLKDSEEIDGVLVYRIRSGFGRDQVYLVLRHGKLDAKIVVRKGSGIPERVSDYDEGESVSNE